MCSFQRTLAVLAMAAAASLAMSQDVKALVRDLRYHGTLPAQKASRLLRDMPIETVTSEIARALKEDLWFQQTVARNGAYGFFDDLVKDRRRQNQAVDRAVLEQLKIGLSDSDSGVRWMVIGTLGCVEPAVQKEVAAWLTPALEDPSLVNVAAVADALRRFESRAADSAPALMKLLRDPDDDTRRRWAAGGNDSVETIGTHYRAEDRDLVARMRAATARLAILGTLVDYDLYPKLDEKGQLAGAMAIVARGDTLASQLGAEPTRARQAVALVAPLLGNPKVNRDMQFAPVMIWALIVARLDGESMKEVRAEALARIEEASKHPDERVSKAAAQMLDGLKKRK